MQLANKFLLGLFLLTFSMISIAQDDDPRKEKGHACAVDFPLFCREEIPNNMNEWRCLSSKMSILSDRCLEFMYTKYDEMYGRGKDMKTYCPGKQKNQANWVKCLDSRRNKLSKTCRASLELKDKRNLIRKNMYSACKADREKYCEKKKSGECERHLGTLPADSLAVDCGILVEELQNTFK